MDLISQRYDSICPKGSFAGRVCYKQANHPIRKVEVVALGLILRYHRTGVFSYLR